jgi:hypothetical protein
MRQEAGRFWMPLIGRFTGAGTEAIARLAVGDNSSDGTGALFCEFRGPWDRGGEGELN